MSFDEKELQELMKGKAGALIQRKVDERLGMVKEILDTYATMSKDIVAEIRFLGNETKMMNREISSVQRKQTKIDDAVRKLLKLLAGEETKKGKRLKTTASPLII